MKNKTTAGLLAFFLGAFGAQYFYLGKRNRGMGCILFCWTFLPVIIAFIDFIRFLVMSEQNFNRRYNSKYFPYQFVNPAVDYSLDDLERLYYLQEKWALTEEEFETRRKIMMHSIHDITAPMIGKW